jgi:hypothetical protein
MDKDWAVSEHTVNISNFILENKTYIATQCKEAGKEK